ncbi:Glucosyltransferase-like protein [Thoreauomyces humboldtii]|nr:Glucosyltransferase-like protein [Thoreauomyces humboldtii]
MSNKKALPTVSSSEFGPVGSWHSFLSRTDGRHLRLLSTLLLAVSLRWLVAQNGYSGAGNPPLHGDFEAQRHWLEITTALPRRQWYTYDLPYWGLDYPLLTAYHSWGLGLIAKAINPAWVALDRSRGLETEGLKVFMRLTALVTELAIYVPAVILFAKYWIPTSDTARKQVLVTLILLQPALIIIDHGHFQYNSAMLGLTLWAIVGLLSGHYLLGSVAFVLALNFKQMALFYALPIFCFLLGVCARTPNRLFVKLGVTVAGTLALVFAIHSTQAEDALQVLRRVFPVERGLYEDKVANVWCALSVVVKLRSLYTQQTLVIVSLLSTLLAALPSSIHVLRFPEPRALLYALFNTSLAFFLLAFQVHEKSILLPALPATLLILDEPFAASYFNTVAMFR